MATTETRQQYEGAILSQLIKNAERQAVFEKDINQIKADLADVKSDLANVKSEVSELRVELKELATEVVTLKLDLAEVKLKLAEVTLQVQSIEASLAWIKWLMGTIALGILVNIFSQPILSFLHLV